MIMTDLGEARAAIAEVLARRRRYVVLPLEVLAGLSLLEDAAIDASYLDPPYGLGDRDPDPEEIAAFVAGGQLDHGGDFMGRDWEIPSVHVWRELRRVLKPGAMAAIHGGPQADDLLSLGARLGGLSRVDAISVLGASRWTWVQAQGMPKHGNLGSQIDEAAGAEREVVGVRADFAARANKIRGDGHWRPEEGAFSSPETIGNITAPATPLGARWEGWHGGLAPRSEPVLLFQAPFARVTSAELHGVTGWEHWHVVHALRKPHQRAEAEGRFGAHLPPAGEAQVLIRRALYQGTTSWSELRWRHVCKVRKLSSVARVACTTCGAVRDLSERSCGAEKGLGVLCGAEGVAPAGWRVEASEAPPAKGAWRVVAASERERFRPWTTQTLVANLLVHGTGALNISATRVGIGRFPPNAVLFHHPRCLRMAPRRVRGSAPGGPAAGERATGSLFAEDRAFAANNGSRPAYSSADGTELVEGSRCLVACVDEACAGEGLELSGGAPPRCPDCGGSMRWCCAAAALDEQSGICKAGIAVTRHGGGGKIFDGISGGRAAGYQDAPRADSGYTDTGGASRFYPQVWPSEADVPFQYAPKSPQAERQAGLGGQKNPGICRKPVERFGRRMVRQIAPPGSVVLVLYAGTGSEVLAALLEGCFVIAFERNPVDAAVARVQAEHVLAHGDDWIEAGELEADPPPAVAPAATLPRQLGLMFK